MAVWPQRLIWLMLCCSLSHGAASSSDSSETGENQSDASMHPDGPLAALSYSLVAIFGAVGLGALSVRFGYVDPPKGEMVALRFFVGKVAFPLLIFKTVATADLNSIDFHVVVACTLGKLLVLTATWGFTYFFYSTGNSIGRRLITATCFGFFVIASDDFAIGFPVIEALYPEELHLDAYIAANAVVGSMFFVPLVTVLLEVGQSVDSLSPEQSRGFKAAAGIFRNIASNPVILFASLGFAYKFLLGRTLREVDGMKHFPGALQSVLDLFTKPFGMLALFATGTVLRKPRVSLWPTALCLMKVGVCAFSSYFFGSLFVRDEQAQSLRDFTFFYGSIPTSSAPLLFTVSFAPGAVDTVASATLIGLVLAGPMMFQTAAYLEHSNMDMSATIQAIHLASAQLGNVVGIVFLVLLLFFRRRWGFKCIGKSTLAVYGLVASLHSLLFVVVTEVEGECDAFNGGQRTLLLLALGFSQNFCKLSLLFLQLGQALDWKFTSKRVVQVVGPLVCLLLSVPAAVFVEPNVLSELCFHEPTDEKLRGNIIWSSMLLTAFLLLVLVHGLWRSRDTKEQTLERKSVHGQPEALSPSSTLVTTHLPDIDVDGADARAQVSSDAGCSSQADWLITTPEPVVRALAACFGLRLLMQVVNAGSKLLDIGKMGSYAAMLTIEGFLEVAQPVMLVAFLLFDNTFSFHLSESVPKICPMWAGDQTVTSEAWTFHPGASRTAHFNDDPCAVDASSVSPASRGSAIRQPHLGAVSSADAEP